VRRECTLAFAAFFCVSFTAGQQAAAPTATPAGASEQPGPTAVYFAGPGVIGPQPVRPALPSAFHRCGTVTLSAVVDAKGKASQIDVLHADDAGLAKLATKLLAKTKFEPGTYNGVPAAVAITAVFDDQICLHQLLSESLSLSVTVRGQPQPDATSPTANGSSAQSGNSDGLYKVGGDVSAPIALNTVAANFSSYARKKKIGGFCLIGLIVDTKGVPEDVHVIQSLEPSLDQNAMDAIKQYRFKPAMKDRKVPVPVAIEVRVDFKLY